MVKVWDGFVRFFHWLLVILIAVLYFSAQYDFLDIHFIAGYTMLALLCSRFIWGVYGSDTARLSRLFHSPGSVIRSVFKPHENIAGHSKLGSYMVLLFFILLTTQTLSGLMTSDEIFMEGPLARYSSNFVIEVSSSLHHLNFNIILVAISLHICTIILYQFLGINLVNAMLTGYSDNEIPKSSFKPGWKGIAIFFAFYCCLLLSLGGEQLKIIF